MVLLAVEPDGILFGPTSRMKRTYKSLNYHRQPGFKPGKTTWAPSVTREVEYRCFEECEAKEWSSSSGDYWWITMNAETRVGIGGERMAFFPLCHNHPGPWHGYPVSAVSNRNYEVPGELVDKWEDEDLIDEIVAGRMRKGKI